MPLVAVAPDGRLAVVARGTINALPEPVFATSNTDTGAVVPIAFKSIDLDIPIVEYRPFRDFATRQASSLLFQIGFGIEVPKNVEVVPPGEGAAPHLGNLYSARVKVLFDWRRYF